MNTQQLTLVRPDDMHVHLRDLPHLKNTLAHTAKQFARAMVMPNLSTPITNCELAAAYRHRILENLPQQHFEPLMSLYLTDQTTADEIEKAARTSWIHAFKLYPSGATTNSAAGIQSFEKLWKTLELMQEHKIVLQIHGEVTDQSVDVFDRERAFIDIHLTRIVEEFPALKIVLEHITSKDAVDFILQTPNNVGATITAHHLLITRNDLFRGGINPHHYCLPIAKCESDKQALIRAAISGNAKFFLGTDSAPHAQHRKESACGCAGIYTAHAALELYAEVFEQANALDQLENFASRFGADFYELPHNTDTITLTKKSWQVPKQYSFGDDILIPFRADQMLSWSTQ